MKIQCKNMFTWMIYKCLRLSNILTFSIVTCDCARTKMKLLLVANVISAFALQAYAGVIVNDHLGSNLVSCKDPAAPGNLQVETAIHEEPHFLHTVEKTITLPESGFFTKAITCILVEDLKTDGSGGIVSITEGGLNQFRVSLHFVSKWGKGLDYRIQIYTHV
ncbi:unnamed protein product [Acanthoscelides obtectus]|uniref:Uncharacterized protein n=1 Tax=Acanthoscelides obtectus TaxID=200917 RepID=A0A9P0L344_ACAOB|nr:unnamed protein product [Acanthoscelides obtectus]CAK1677647.1 hypothetical protein AOBTE_LOCUS31457 [Acanthoscelides obtectus]